MMLCCDEIIGFTADCDRGGIFAVWNCKKCGDFAACWMGKPNTKDAGYANLFNPDSDSLHINLDSATNGAESEETK